jgi:hypothetical protein
MDIFFAHEEIDKFAFFEIGGVEYNVIFKEECIFREVKKNG